MFYLDSSDDTVPACEWTTPTTGTPHIFCVLQYCVWPYYSCTYTLQHFLNNFYFDLSLYRNHTVLPKITSNTVEWLYPHVYTITVQSSKSSWCVILMSSNKSETHWPEGSVSMAPAKCIYHLHVCTIVPTIVHLPCTWHECIVHIIYWLFLLSIPLVRHSTCIALDYVDEWIDSWSTREHACNSFSILHT